MKSQARMKKSSPNLVLARNYFQKSVREPILSLSPQLAHPPQAEVSLSWAISLAPVNAHYSIRTSFLLVLSQHPLSTYQFEACQNFLFAGFVHF